MVDRDDPLVKVPSRLNPYRLAAELAFRRLIWDLRIESWVSRRKLNKIKNSYLDEKAVILCNGPSLRKIDLACLEDIFTFGLNKINLLFPDTGFRPSCIVAVNQFVIEQNLEFYKKTDIPLFIDSNMYPRLGGRSNITYLHSTMDRRFAKDVSFSIYQGHTVTFVAMQLAFHMGFKNVALIGCDHDFASNGPANKEVESGSVDKSHFHPNYFSGGVKWHLPDLFESEVSYTMAKNMYEAFGRKIINCTEGGRLEIFERMPIDEFLKCPVGES